MALSLQHIISMRYIVVCGLPGSVMFFDIISQMARFSKKKMNIQRVFRFSLHGFSEIFLILRRTERDRLKCT